MMRTTNPRKERQRSDRSDEAVHILLHVYYMITFSRRKRFGAVRYFFSVYLVCIDDLETIWSVSLGREGKG